MQDSVLWPLTWRRGLFSRNKAVPETVWKVIINFFLFFSFWLKLQIQIEHIKQVKANMCLINALTSNYSHFVPILTLRRDNSGIVLRKVRIPTLRNKVRIPTLRRTIPELYRFLLCAEHIYLENRPMMTC